MPGTPFRLSLSPHLPTYFRSNVTYVLGLLSTFKSVLKTNQYRSNLNEARFWEKQHVENGSVRPEPEIFRSGYRFSAGFYSNMCKKQR